MMFRIIFWQRKVRLFSIHWFSSTIYLPQRLAGMAVLAVYSFVSRREKKQSSDKNETASPRFPGVLSAPTPEELPWKDVAKSKYARISAFVALCALIQAYFLTGRLSIWWEDFFYLVAYYRPMTAGLHRALCVLWPHLSWIGMGAAILRILPRPQPFFGKWYRLKARTQWVWWSLGGYMVSCLLFNIADFVNQCILPLSILEQAADSIVSQLINPEFNDKVAAVCGYIAPCVTAPWVRMYIHILYQSCDRRVPSFSSPSLVIDSSLCRLFTASLMPNSMFIL